MKTAFTIKGEIEIHYNGKIFKHHNNLSDDAKVIVSHCLGGDVNFRPRYMKLVYQPTGTGELPQFTYSPISEVNYQNDGKELKLSALFNLEWDDDSSSSAIIKSVYLLASEYPLGTFDFEEIQFSSVDLTNESPAVETTSKIISINWIIKPQ